MNNAKTPSQQYLTLLAIKAVITKWQDLDIDDTQAINQIKTMMVGK